MIRTGDNNEQKLAPMMILLGVIVINICVLAGLVIATEPVIPNAFMVGLMVLESAAVLLVIRRYRSTDQQQLI